jgi:E3 ubiquitin-protein ligase HERC4
MGITKKGELYSWGANTDGQLGLGHKQESETPTKIDGLPSGEKIVDVACGHSHVLALTSKGHIYSWGNNESGECGLGFKNPVVLDPQKILIRNIIRVFANFHSMALTRDGKLYVWGCNSYGSLGIPDSDNRNHPVLLREGVVSAACGGGHSLALLENGDLLSWGSNTEGQLGMGDNTPRIVPEILPISGKLRKKKQHPVSIGCCFDHSFFVTNKGDLYMWGLGHQGQLGRGSAKSRSKPGKVKLKMMVSRELENQKWDDIFLWLFLGRAEGGSAFSGFPLEVIVNIVGLCF